MAIDGWKGAAVGIGLSVFGAATASADNDAECISMLEQHYNVQISEQKADKILTNIRRGWDRARLDVNNMEDSGKLPPKPGVIAHVNAGLPITYSNAVNQMKQSYCRGNVRTFIGVFVDPDDLAMQMPDGVEDLIDNKIEAFTPKAIRTAEGVRDSLYNVASKNGGIIHGVMVIQRDTVNPYIENVAMKDAQVGIFMGDHDPVIFKSIEEAERQYEIMLHGDKHILSSDEFSEMPGDSFQRGTASDETSGKSSGGDASGQAESSYASDAPSMG
ncbi:MAG: hypothetical protein ACRBDL_05745 [Alphaproteobacteria bacterium]